MRIIVPANSADSSPTSPDLLSRSAMGARFPPAQGPAVDCPEYSTDQCKTVQSDAHEAIPPAAPPGRKSAAVPQEASPRDGCTWAEAFGGAGNSGADVDATNADGFPVALRGKHCADGNRVGSRPAALGRHLPGPDWPRPRPGRGRQRARIADVHGWTA